MLSVGWVSSRYSACLRAGRSRDRILVGARYSAPVHTGLVAHPVSYTMGTASFLWVKTGEHGTDHPSLSKAKIKESVELYIHLHSRLLWPVLGWTVPIPPLCAVLFVLYTVTSKGRLSWNLCVCISWLSFLYTSRNIFDFFFSLLVIVFCRCFL